MDGDRTDRAVVEWREAYRALQSPGGDACPGDDELATLAIEAGETAARRALGDHVAICRRCSDRLRDLFDLHATAGEGAVDRGTRLPTMLAPIAAILLIGLAGFSAWLIVGRTGPDVAATLRGDGTPTLAVTPPDAAVLAVPPTSLEFVPPGTGTTARVGSRT